MTTGEERRLRRHDDGHAGAHGIAVDQRRVPDTHALDVGDRVMRSAIEPADADAEISGAHLASKLDVVAQTEERRELWGGETRKAVANFPVSGEPIPPAVARWLGRIKAAAARVNAELGLLEPEKAERIGAAGDRIAAGGLDDQFPIDVFQTGSGTSSNMNANEVIASLAGDDVHANDDVNMGQSSNDVFPSAVHLAALDEITNDLLPALDRLAASLPITCAATCVTTSGMTGLTFPGMIELPFCSSGRKISASPARGPEPIRRRSFAIFVSETATVFSAPESSTTNSRSMSSRPARARPRT